MLVGCRLPFLESTLSGFVKTADVAICCAIPDAYPVRNGVRSSFQQAPRGRHVSRVDLVIAALDVNYDKRPLVDRSKLGSDPVPENRFTANGNVTGHVFPTGNSVFPVPML